MLRVEIGHVILAGLTEDDPEHGAKNSLAS
jgi:hypothetical protein